jgi:hypothetical protein
MFGRMKNRATLLTAIGLIVCLAISGTALGILLYQKTVTVSMTSSSYTLEIWNVDKTSQVNAIDAGFFDPGETKDCFILVHNASNRNCTVFLTITASSGWEITSSFSNQFLDVDEWTGTVRISITNLSAEPGNIGSGTLDFIVQKADAPK